MMRSLDGRRLFLFVKEFSPEPSNNQSKKNCIGFEKKKNSTNGSRTREKLFYKNFSLYYYSPSDSIIKVILHLSLSKKCLVINLSLFFHFMILFWTPGVWSQLVIS